MGTDALCDVLTGTWAVRARPAGSLPARRRADLYQALAEALAEPPEWLAQAGREWLLYELAEQWGAMPAVVEALASIRAEPLSARKSRYSDLFASPGGPRFWLSEAAHRSGRLLGPETAVVAQVYRAAGLVTVGAELPDHASLELAFLAYVAERQVAEADQAEAWWAVEQRFINDHAGCWLPQLGRALAGCGDEVYAPIGQLLTACFTKITHSRQSASAGRRLPRISSVQACSLCGFCAQVCPTRALVVHETAQETRLLLAAGACVGCGRCERICEAQVLHLGPVTSGAVEYLGQHQVLRRSPRAACAGCGRPLVSQAELDCVAARIGDVPWLHYCLDCRDQTSAAFGCGRPNLQPRELVQ